MLFILRKFRKKLLQKNSLTTYIFYAFGEIALVVAGILIALQVNNWNETKKENETAEILAISLIDDLNQDITFLEDAVDFSDEKLENCDKLLAVLKTPIESWDNVLFYEKINIVGQSNPFFPTDGTYAQMVTSGSLKYFNQSISNQLNAYNMNSKKVLYWSNAEDETLWLMANILWKGLNVQALDDIRFNRQTKNIRYIKIKAESIDEFSNYVAAVKTYRSKSLIEYKEQLRLAKKIIFSLKKAYGIRE